MANKQTDTYSLRKIGETISGENAETAPNKNVRINRRYLLNEPEVRALHVIKSGDAITEKMWRSLWTKGLIENTSSPIMPRLTPYGNERLKWVCNDLNPSVDDVKFPVDPKVKNGK